MERLIENVTQQIDALLRDKEIWAVAIDGKCTSGKTTLAARLAEIYDCNVFHMRSRRKYLHKVRMQNRSAMVGSAFFMEGFGCASVLSP